MTTSCTNSTDSAGRVAQLETGNSCFLRLNATRVLTSLIYRRYAIISVIRVRIFSHIPPSAPDSLMPYGRAPDLLSCLTFPLIQRLLKPQTRCHVR